MSAGRCRFCGCTEDNTCRLPNSEPCGWLVRTQDVCNAPRCIRAWQAEQASKAAAEKLRTRRRTPAEIHQLILEERRARRRQYRANRAARKKSAA